MRRLFLLLVCSLTPSLARAEPPRPAGALLGRPLALSLGAWAGGGPWGAWLGIRLPLSLSGDKPARPDPPAPPPGPDPGRPGRVPPERLKKLLRAAWKAAALGDARLDDLASRARRAALLPEVRLRALRGDDQALRYSPTDGEELRAQATGQASTTVEARLTFRLDRLIFADEEVAIERLRQELHLQRGRVAQRLSELIAAWQKSSARAAQPGLPPEDLAEAQAAADGAAVALDALTDGAWSAP